METGTEYTKFRLFLRNNFRYKKGTKRPVTFHVVVSGFEGWEELSNQVLSTFIEELNRGTPVIQQKGVYYLNLKKSS